MPERPFVHLHCHTDYSLLDGACDIKQLMALAKYQQMPAIAMTDHGNLFGAVEFYSEANNNGIHPVIGCEVYVSQQGHKTRSEADRYNHLVLLSENQDGYRNLINLVSTGYLDGFYYKPRISKKFLAEHAKGLIGLSGCLAGEVCENLLAGKYEAARSTAAMSRARSAAVTSSAEETSLSSMAVAASGDGNSASCGASAAGAKLGLQDRF